VLCILVMRAEQAHSPGPRPAHSSDEQVRMTPPLNGNITQQNNLEHGLLARTDRTFCRGS
jgi:hypothetical protein